jgi:N6-adenosine-specific RNA methylase IME4
MDKEWQVIYADPPWQYDFSNTESRSIETHYPTMTHEEIKAYPVHPAENSVLFLWATAPKLLEALEVMKAWGFEYKTHAVWDKELIGTGYWFRNQHELLLVGTRGHFSPPSESQRISSVLLFKRLQHSRKPDAIRRLIQEWYPDMTKVELFGRTKVVGWNTEGNEVPKLKTVAEFDEEEK